MGQEALVVAAGIDIEEVNAGIPGDFEEEQMMGEGGSESHPRVEEVGLLAQSWSQP